MPETQLRSLAEFPASARRRIDIVLFDIDDAITFEDRIPARAFRPSRVLYEAGQATDPVSSRPQQDGAITSLTCGQGAR